MDQLSHTENDDFWVGYIGHVVTNLFPVTYTLNDQLILFHN